MNDATQSSMRVCQALAALHKSRRDDKFFASGLTVTVTDLEGNPVVEPVTVGGEYTNELQNALINVLEVTAEHKLQLLNLQTSDLKAALHKSRGLTK